MFTNRFKILVALLCILAGVGILALSLTVLDKKASSSLYLSEQALKQSNDALKQVAQFPTLTPTATPTATVRFVPRTPVVTKTAPVVK